MGGTNSGTRDPAVVQPGNTAGPTQPETTIAEMQHTIDTLRATNQELLVNMELLNGATADALAAPVGGTNSGSRDPAVVQPRNTAGPTQPETTIAEMQHTIDTLRATNQELLVNMELLNGATADALAAPVEYDSYLAELLQTITTLHGENASLVKRLQRETGMVVETRKK